MAFVMLVERLVTFDRKLWSYGPFLHEKLEKYLIFSENSDFDAHLPQKSRGNVKVLMDFVRSTRF